VSFWAPSAQCCGDEKLRNNLLERLRRVETYCDCLKNAIEERQEKPEGRDGVLESAVGVVLAVEFALRNIEEMIR
jgi:hypothetical protein